MGPVRSKGDNRRERKKRGGEDIKSNKREREEASLEKGLFLQVEAHD